MNKRLILAAFVVCCFFLTACAQKKDIGKQNGGASQKDIIKEGSYTIWTSRDFYKNAGVIAAYPRVITIRGEGKRKGMQLVTFECYKKGHFSSNASLPVFVSGDDGQTWEQLSVCDSGSSKYMQFFQPCLYELEKKWGKYPAGTILLAGNLCTGDSTNLVLYASKNQGEDWELCGRIDTGGAPQYDPSPASRTTPVWEPELIQLEDGSVVCFYSDERYKDRDILQAIVYKVSKDGGKSWSSPVMTVGIADKSKRPGMWTICRLGDGRYFACYEMVNETNMPTFYKISEDGLNWGDAGEKGVKIEDSSGNSVIGSPYCLFDGKGDKLYVSGKHFGKTTYSDGYYMTTKNLENFVWQKEKMPFHYTASDGVNEAYSQSMCMDSTGTAIIHVINQLDSEGNVRIECHKYMTKTS